MPDDLSATLAGIREHLRVAELGGLAEWSDGYIPSALYRSSRSLLKAVEAVLKDHRKSMFPAGPPGAGDAYGKHYCAGICYTSIDDQVIYRVWPCQPYRAITTALTGKPASDEHGTRPPSSMQNPAGVIRVITPPPQSALAGEDGDHGKAE